jgi:hypothetical protein
LQTVKRRASLPHGTLVARIASQPRRFRPSGFFVSRGRDSSEPQPIAGGHDKARSARTGRVAVTYPGVLTGARAKLRRPVLAEQSNCLVAANDYRVRWVVDGSRFPPTEGQAKRIADALPT